MPLTAGNSPGWRTRWRVLRLGLPTLLGARPMGYFLPYRHAAEMPQPGAVPAYPALEEAFAAAAPEMRALLHEITALAPALQAIGAEPAPSPRWTQDWFPTLDGAAAYALLRRLRPRRIVEVGSGHSTRFLARAAADAGMATEITCIDPAPRAALGALPVTWLRRPVHEAGEAPFRRLGPGDLLFVDSSHLLVPGSDVDWLLNRVLPSLASGVLLHVHDIFLPDDYPAGWAWRGYNEQNAVALLCSQGWPVLFASHYVATRLPEALADSAVAGLPQVAGALPSSLWLRKP